MNGQGAGAGGSVSGARGGAAGVQRRVFTTSCGSAGERSRAGRCYRQPAVQPTRAGREQRMGQPNLTVSHRPSAARRCAPPPLRLAPRSVPLESLIKAGSQQVPKTNLETRGQNPLSLAGSCRDFHFCGNRDERRRLDEAGAERAERVQEPGIMLTWRMPSRNTRRC